MQQPFTKFLRLLLLALALGTGYTSWAQATYTPIALTGFNQDIIANGTGAVSATTTADIDGAVAVGGTGYCLMSQDYVGPTGQAPTNATYPALETSGLITSVLNSAITYQLASYSANNTLRLYGATASGTLSFATPSAASELYVIGTSGNATSVLDVTVTFADGTTQVFASQSIADWFATGQTNVVREKLGRVSRNDNTVQYTSSPVGPRFYQLKLVLSQANIQKNITGITFSRSQTGTISTGTAVIMAVTAGVYPVCAATPTNLAAAATTTSGGTTALTSACTSTNIFLSLTGLPSTAMAGYTYQWQSSTTSATTGFTNITGATSSTYTATGQAVATYYRAVVTCLYDGAGGTAVNSTAVQVTQNPVTNCYCVPTASTGCGTNGIITSVAITGTAFSSSPGCISATSPGYVSAYYASFVGAGTPTATLVGNTSYTITGTVGRTSRVVMWIDYDQSGTFDASEYTQIAYNTATTATTYSATFLVPTAALGGTTRMRIRSDISSATVLTTVATAPCATTTNGESLDYTITISPAVACTGNPPAPTAASSAASVCSGTAFTLTASAQIAGTFGYSYQWQSSPAGTNSFANLGTAQTATTYAVTTQAAATDYRVIITCTGSGLTTTSNVVTVTQNPFYYCYCTPVTAGTGTDGITNVTLGLLNNTSSATNTSPYYTDYTTPQLGNTLPTPVLTPGGTATVSVKMGTDTHQFSGVWIDFDHSSTFDTGEYFTLGTDAGASGTSLIPITIPSTALSGLTKMRVRGGDDVVLLSTQSCTAATSTSNFGEVEDYFVNIAPAAACAGTLPATTATATASAACTATPGFTLGVTGLAAGITGVTYQWQSSPTGTNTFTNLGSVQTTPGYAVTSQTATLDYRVIVTCTASASTSTSSPVTVTQQATCYCAPISTGTGEYIESVTLPGFNGFTNTSYINSLNGYGDYTTVPTLTTTLNQGVTYTNGVSLTIRVNNGGSQGGMWVDYDHSGTFDASEYTLIGTSSATGTDVTLLATLTVPTTALLGPTRVRVRWRNGAFAATDACTSGLTTWYGETEDYVITIAAPCTPSTANFSYPAGPYCVSGTTNPTPTLATGATAGTFSSTTGLTLNATTGVITLSSSTPGTYTVTSTVAATVTQCASTATTSVIINAAPTAGFSYAGAPYCVSGTANPVPVMATGATMGTFSSTTGLSINATTGIITPSSSTPGTYTVTNTVVASNGCAPVTATTTVTINAAPTAGFSYPTTAICAGSTATLTPTLATGAVVGTYSLPTTTGLSINANGVVTVAATAAAGTYTVTNTVAAANGCAQVLATATFTITPQTTATFSYSGSPYCASSTTNPTPTITGTAGGTFSSTTGLTLSATTGVVTLASSTPGTYTVTYTVAGTCGSSSTQSLTINATLAAGFSYPAGPYCVSGTTNPAVTLGTGATAGTFTSTTGLTLNATTGAITLSSSTPGTYTVTNTVAASGGCAAASSTATVTINAAPTAGFSFATSPYCVSGTTNPTVTLSTGATMGTFTASPSGLTINATTGAITLAGSTPGTYTVTNTVAAANGCAQVTATATVTINAAPTAGFTYPTTAICAGSAATLTPTLATGAAAGTYTLPTATGLSINATTGVVTAAATATAGTYTVTNTVAAANGCAAVTSTATFTLTAPTTATFSYSGSPYCVSGTTNPTPTITGTAGGTFSSTTGLSISATTGVITLSSSTAGTYTVTYTVAGTCGSSSTQSVTISSAATAGFSYPTTTACAGTATTRTPTLATGASAGTYSLPTATGLSINATTGVVTIGATAVAGTYTVTNTVAASGGCAAVASTATFTITAAPVTPTLTTSGTPATGITLTSSAATGNQYYLNGVAIAGATGQTYLINSGNQNGSYTVTVTNAAGCSATSAAVAVTVTATAPAAASTSLTLYPNPTRDGQLTLELSGYQETVQLEVVNALGQRVYEASLSGNALTQKQTLNLSHLAAGVYLLEVRTASGNLQVRRFVREL